MIGKHAAIGFSLLLAALGALLLAVLSIPQHESPQQHSLRDGEEINIYKTDPIKQDTEGDGLKDGEEIVEYLKSFLMIGKEVEEKFIQKLKERVDALSVGNGLGSRIDMGPLNSAGQREKISRLVDEIREKAAAAVAHDRK